MPDKRGNLSNDEIREALRALELPTEFGFDEEAKAKYVNDVIQKFWKFDVYRSAIAIPEYFEILKVFLKSRKTPEFTRSEFYEFLVQNLLKGAEDKRRPLQMLATALELLQANELPLARFVEFQKLLEVDTALPVQELTDRKLFTSDGKEISCVHHTVQEYLAAQYVFGSDDPSSEVDALMVLKSEEITAFKPTWHGVMRFLFESDKRLDFIGWYLDFKEAHPDDVDENTAEYLSAIDREGVLPELQGRIFDLIYDSYQSRAVWLPFWAGEDIGAFTQKDQITTVQGHLVASDEAMSTYVRQANAVMVVGSMLTHENSYVTAKMKSDWKALLIQFANNNNPNGVLQRKALNALATYGDDQIITDVSHAFDHPESLVKEAFLRFCVNIAPNNQHTIGYLAQGIEDGLTVQGRVGLYKINSKDGIKHLLNRFLESNDDVLKYKFLDEFIDHESIFNDRGKRQDDVLLDQTDEYFDEEIGELAEQIIWAALAEADIFQAERSYFIGRLVEIIESRNPGYLQRIFDKIKGTTEKKPGRVLYNYNYVLARVIKPEDVEFLFGQVKALKEENPWTAVQIINQARYLQPTGKGEQVYEKARELGLVDDTAKEENEKMDQERYQKIYNQFKLYLEPSEGKYIPAVFKYYVDNREIIEQWITPEQRKRLKHLMINEGFRFKPREFFKVTFKTEVNAESRQLTYTGPIEYYGDVLRLAQELIEQKRFTVEDLRKYRQDVIDFIPFAYSQGQEIIKEVLELVGGPPEDQELDFVNAVMLGEKGDQARYFLPSEVVHELKKYIELGIQLPSVKPVLKSLINDPKLNPYGRRAALQTYALMLEEDSGDKEYLRKIAKDKTSEDFEERQLGEIANEILIDKYGDPAEVDWRFKQLEERKVEYEEPPADGVVRGVPQVAEELREMTFAKPLIKIAEDLEFARFVHLLDFGLTLGQQNNYKAYFNYLIEITVRAAKIQIAQKFTYEPVKALEDWYEANKQEANRLWFLNRLEDLRRSYINWMGRQGTGKYLEEVRDASR